MVECEEVQVGLSWISLGRAGRVGLHDMQYGIQVAAKFELEDLKLKFSARARTLYRLFSLDGFASDCQCLRIV